MNIERIRELAKQADLDWHKHWNDDDSNKLEKFAALVAFAEREACARVCEEHPDGLKMLGGDFVTCAAAIRARGNK